MNIAAIVLAAGRSTRMDGQPKGLVALGGKTMLEHCISALSQNGLSDIRVVTGHRAAEFTPTHDYTLVYNPDFHQGMFSSIQAGLRSLIAQSDKTGETPEAVFLLPVDAALLKPRTVMDILEHWTNERGRKPEDRRALIPGMLGRTGHPVLIPERFFASILDWKGDYGLRGCLAAMLPPEDADAFMSGRLKAGRGGIQLVGVADQGVLSDIDTPEDLAEAEAFLEETEQRTMPSLEEAWQILRSGNLTPLKIRHSVLVALGSFRLATALAQRGFPANPALCLGAGLLHDLFRQEREHAIRAFEVFSLLGWPKTAFVAGCHTILPSVYRRRMGIDIYDSGFMHPPVPDSSQKLADEFFYSSIAVYLADKYAKNDLLVSLAERFSGIRDWFAADAERVKAIDRREQIAQLMEEWLAERLWSRPADVVAHALDHPMEDRLKAVYESSDLSRDDRHFHPWCGAAGQPALASTRT